MILSFKAIIAGLIRRENHSTDSHRVDVLAYLLGGVLIRACLLHHVCKLHFALIKK